MSGSNGIQKLQEGQSVWWRDPDANACSGWYQVKAIDVDNAVVFLQNDVGSEVEADVNELQAFEPTLLDLTLEFSNEGYHCGDACLNNPEMDGQRGDGLADFIATELRETLEGVADPALAQEIVRNALEKAVSELEGVIEAVADNPDFIGVASQLQSQTATPRQSRETMPGM